MTHSNQVSGVERGAARVQHNRRIKGVLEFPLPRDIHEVWFQIFLPKNSDTLPLGLKNINGTSRKSSF